MISSTDVDAKARFYLEHRAVIEEWAKLREEARALLERELARLEEPLSALSSGAGHQGWFEPDANYALLLAQRPEWVLGATGISVGVGWQRRNLLVPGIYEWPWVGVYLDGAESVAGRRVTSRLKTLRPESGGAYQKSSPWALWRYVEPEPEMAVDPATLAAAALDETRALWAAVTAHLGKEPFAPA